MHSKEKSNLTRIKIRTSKRSLFKALREITRPCALLLRLVTIPNHSTASETPLLLTALNNFNCVLSFPSKPYYAYRSVPGICGRLPSPNRRVQSLLSEPEEPLPYHGDCIVPCHSHQGHVSRVFVFCLWACFAKKK